MGPVAVHAHQYRPGAVPLQRAQPLHRRAGHPAAVGGHGDDRHILSALKKAGLITVARGTGGAELCRAPEEITLYQIYDALEPDGLTALIGIHPCGKSPCPVAQNIKAVLKGPYHKIENAIREAMESVTLADMLEDYHARTAEQAP
ncbi:hypothetical protein B5E80_16650 [Flavonifractor sp. An135]|nr:hypothetical protein B5E80_16650 [Flavonifractor sp. An135]